MLAFEIIGLVGVILFLAALYQISEIVTLYGIPKSAWL